MAKTKLNAIFKISLTMLIIVSIFLTYALTITVLSNREKLEYIPVNINDKYWLNNIVINESNEIEYQDLSKHEIREKVINLFKPKLFIEVNLDELPINNADGLTWLTIRLIQIRNDISSYNYCFVLAHEYTHLNNMISDENLTDFIAIKTLYESGDSYLRKAALIRIHNKIWSDNGNDYDCTYQLIQYFK